MAKPKLFQKRTKQSSGYHKSEDIIRDLVPFGFSEDLITENINFLIKNRAIITESQSEEDFREGDLVSLGSAGFVYLDLVNDVYYLGSIAEATIYHDEKTAQQIANRIALAQHYDYATMLENAKVLVDFLEDYKLNYLLQRPNEFLFNESLNSLLDISESKEIIERNLLELTRNTTYNIEKEYPRGSKVVCEIMFKKEYGVFVEFGLRANGFIHISRFEKHSLTMEDFEIGDILECDVIEFNKEFGRFSLAIVNWK